jgi:aspartyl-tRNA(Asn)/glutamyl-tRNA(Gln) amidotransferase subunit C
MSVNIDEIDNCAHLARLDLDSKSRQAIREKTANTLEMSEELFQVDTAGVAPMFNPVAGSQFLRPDEVKAKQPSKELQQCAPEIENGCYIVPSVI